MFKRLVQKYLVVLSPVNYLKSPAITFTNVPLALGVCQRSSMVLRQRRSLKNILLSQARFFTTRFGSLCGGLQIFRFLTRPASARSRIFVGGGSTLAFFGFFSVEEDPDLSIEDTIIMTLKRAILAIQRDQLDKAEGYLNKAWRLSEKEGMEDVKTQVIDMQANLALQKGDLTKAEKLFKATAQRLVNLKKMSPDDNSIIEISIKLAQIYLVHDRILDAITGYEYCIESQEAKILKGADDSDTLLLTAWAMHNLAQIYMNLATIQQKPGIINQAQELTHKALKLVYKAEGPESQQAIAIIGDIAAIHALNGDFEMALEKIKEAEAIADVEHEFLLALLRVNKGNIYLQKGDFNEANRLCVEAKALAGKFNDLESKNRADECISKAKIMKAEAENEKKKSIN